MQLRESVEKCQKGVLSNDYAGKDGSFEKLVNSTYFKWSITTPLAVLAPQPRV